MDLDNFAKSEDTSSTHSMPAENGSKLNIKEERWGPLTFEDVHPKLPADKPVGYAHIVKLNRGDYVEIEDDECRLEDLRIGDGIVTFLYHWKPEELDKFLDHENYPKFEFWSRPKKSTGYHNFFIGRDGESVRCGWFDPAMKIWDGCVDYTFNGTSRKWEPVMGHVWMAGMLAPFITFKEDIENMGRELAGNMISMKMWVESNSFTMVSTDFSAKAD